MSTGMRIKGDALKEGQWIQFCTQKKVDQLSIRRQSIYRPNQHFLVISPCALGKCFLIDTTGKIHDYTTSTNTLHRIRLTEDVTIRVVAEADVIKTHDFDTVQAVHKAAKRFLGHQSDRKAQAIKDAEDAVTTAFSLACIIC